MPLLACHGLLHLSGVELCLFYHTISTKLLEVVNMSGAFAELFLAPLAHVHEGGITRCFFAEVLLGGTLVSYKCAERSHINCDAVCISKEILFHFEIISGGLPPPQRGLGGSLITQRAFLTDTAAKVLLFFNIRK